MKEYDLPSAELLESFKRWADENFGSVQVAFKALDADGGGTVSLSELKKGCRKLKWQGEVKLLFDCLGGGGEEQGDGGRKAITVKDVIFLDSWEVSVPTDAAAEKEAILARFERERENSRSSPASRPSQSHASRLATPASAGHPRSPAAASASPAAAFRNASAGTQSRRVDANGKANRPISAVAMVAGECHVPFPLRQLQRAAPQTSAKELQSQQRPQSLQSQKRPQSQQSPQRPQSQPQAQQQRGQTADQRPNAERLQGVSACYNVGVGSRPGSRGSARSCKPISKGEQQMLRTYCGSAANLMQPKSRPPPWLERAVLSAPDLIVQ